MKEYQPLDLGSSFSVPVYVPPGARLPLPVAEGQGKTLVLSLGPPDGLHTVNHQLSQLGIGLRASWTHSLLHEGPGGLKPGLLLRKVNLVKTSS